MGKKGALRVGFEPTRENPSDFESDALTTRPSQHNMEKTSSFTHYEMSHSLDLYYYQKYL